MLFRWFNAAASASAKDDGPPPPLAGPAELPVEVGATGSPRASCSKVDGFSSCDLSVLRRAEMPPAPLIEASSASLPVSPVASVKPLPWGWLAGCCWARKGGGGGGAAAAWFEVGIAGGGGGGGGAEPELPPKAVCDEGCCGGMGGAGGAGGMAPPVGAA